MGGCEAAECVPVLVVDLVTVSWGVHNVEAESDAILGDDCTPLHSTTEFK